MLAATSSMSVIVSMTDCCFVRGGLGDSVAFPFPLSVLEEAASESANSARASLALASMSLKTLKWGVCAGVSTRSEEEVDVCAYTHPASGLAAVSGMPCVAEISSSSSTSSNSSSELLPERA